MQHRCQVNQKDRDGRTPLMLASIDGHKPIIELLIAHKADVNLRELKCVERRNLNSVDLSDQHSNVAASY